MADAFQAADRCDITDEIEAAITLKKNIRVHMQDGSQCSGRPTDLVTRDGDDWLQLENQAAIPVSKIRSVERQF